MRMQSSGKRWTVGMKVKILWANANKYERENALIEYFEAYDENQTWN